VPGDSVAGQKAAAQKGEADKPAVEIPKPAPPEATPAARPAATQPKASPVALTEPAGEGFGVQVTAVRDQANAEGVARRLVSKGHKAYVLPPSARSRMFRVVVGKFKTRPEAEQAKRRLEREEQFKPWIIR
jgi:cell division septation protein DedD